MERKEKKLEEHITKVTKVIEKINLEQPLDDSDIRETFKSIMNGQIMISEKQDEIENKIKSLEDFLFRDSKKNRRRAWRRYLRL